MYRSRRAFSLVELLVVMAIATMLAALTLAVASRLRSEARMVGCMNNLRRIALGMELYFADERVMPGPDIKRDLAPYVASSDAWICPEDPEPQGDSYSRFCVWGQGAGPDCLHICCPRHGGNSWMAGVFGSFRTEKKRLSPVLCNGSPLVPGELVTDGTLEFADGSTAVISPVDGGAGDVLVRLVTSFEKATGRLYAVLRVEGLREADIQLNVTPGSTFEIVSPAGIMGVRGTTVRTVVRWKKAAAGMYVGVQGGMVTVDPSDVDLCVKVTEDSPSKAVKKAEDFAEGKVGLTQYETKYGREFPELFCHPGRQFELTAGEQAVMVKYLTLEEMDYYESMLNGGGDHDDGDDHDGPPGH